MTERSRLTKELQAQIQCPLCYEYVDSNLRSHITAMHGEDALRRAVLADKERGMSDPEIGERYGISFGTLEQFITEAYGANVSVLERSKRIKRWQPPNFREEMTTVWSFKQRGDWATHNGRYRGNWSPSNHSLQPTAPSLALLARSRRLSSVPVACEKSSPRQ